MVQENNDNFKLEVKYNGVEYEVNPVKDSMFVDSAEEEKKTISSKLAKYSLFHADAVRELDFLQKELDFIIAKEKPNAVSIATARAGKSTESLVDGIVKESAEYQSKASEVIQAKFKVNALEKCIWSLKTKADNITSSIRTEFKQKEY